MIRSLKENKKGILLMLISSVCACIGQLLWKLAGSRGMLYLIVGFGLYGIGALIMLIAYRYGKLSVLQPMLAMNYVLSIILGKIVLQETITVGKIIGVLSIVIGVLLIAGGDSE